MLVKAYQKSFETNYNNVHVGTCFWYEKNLYMKTMDVYGSPGYAVRLSSGKAFWFNSVTMVTPDYDVNVVNGK